MSRQVRSLLINVARIQSKIEWEQRRLAPNWITLLRLKIIRVRLKDRLRALTLDALGRRSRAAPVLVIGSAMRQVVH